VQSRNITSSLKDYKLSTSVYIPTEFVTYPCLKDLKMKHITLILFSFLFLTGTSEGKEVSYLQERGGISYEVNSEIPFTGKLVEKYWSGQKQSEANFKNGKLEGLATLWYQNGQKKIEYNYKNGKFQGLLTEWHENGQKKDEGNYRNGKPEGVHTSWYENGLKSSEAIWKDGRPIEYNGFP